MHAGHYGQSKIIDVDQFNKDLDYCKQVEVDLKSDLQMKAECEISLGNDIRTIDKSSQREKEASSRVVSESSKAWDLEQKKKAVSDSVIDMSLYFPHESVIESLPPIPRIERNENDSFAAIMTKMLTRSLQYRFDFMPLKMKQEVLDFYHADSSSDDSFLFARELGSIVMQMVSVILSKGERGELWISKPNTEGRTIEMTWSKEERMRQWVRSLDSNLLSCDDTAIIQLILLKKIIDITEVDFSQYYSEMQSMKSNSSQLNDNRQLVDMVCSKCGNKQMLRFAIKEYVPISTHDEIWVNKDAVDFLVEFTCPRCGYQFRSENWLE
ncbi:hypothetical protein JH06_3465 [Blastocystis sp. subtype 4]|uniref:hypothetical protein n=1 Tax=Blastocystis sp. subtype 4 TaxID=944170 RepID=UPI00071165E8|nr:hypothetical protein JH06_3465 [Blastocystis sp. subtype 4]KNB44286.1 hypothetical protein JH06_3465 [Blastocystis sp. subtype 4]|eukprot:XP_014527729.1 hypothetical protein JH06_3465 [Blastocystis sp. subtype 4]